MPIKNSQHLVNSILHPWSSLSSERTGKKIHLSPYSISIRFHLPAEIGKLSAEHQVGFFICLGSGWFVGVFFLTSQPNISESSQPYLQKRPSLPWIKHFRGWRTTMLTAVKETWSIQKSWFDNFMLQLQGTSFPSRDFELVGSYQDRHCTS